MTPLFRWCNVTRTVLTEPLQETVITGERAWAGVGGGPSQWPCPEDPLQPRPPALPNPAGTLAAGAFLAEPPLPYPPGLAAHRKPFCWNPPDLPVFSKETAASHPQRSPAPSGWASFPNPTCQRRLLRAPFPAGGGFLRSHTGPHGLSAGLARFQEEPRAGRRQQGAGALAAGRVRGRALPALRVDAGQDAERLPRPAGEGGPGGGASPEREGTGGQSEGRGCAPQTHAGCQEKEVGG